MAINSSEVAVYNATITAAMAALELLIETAANGDELIFVPVETMKGTATGDTRFGADTSAIFDAERKRHYVKITQGVADAAAIPLKIGTHPAYFKIALSDGTVP